MGEQLHETIAPSRISVMRVYSERRRARGDRLIDCGLFQIGERLDCDRDGMLRPREVCHEAQPFLHWVAVG
jgi:hypothetical protein